MMIFVEFIAIWHFSVFCIIMLLYYYVLYYIHYYCAIVQYFNIVLLYLCTVFILVIVRELELIARWEVMTVVGNRPD